MKQEIERKYGVKNLPDNLKIESIWNIEQVNIYRESNKLYIYNKDKRGYRG